MDAAPAATAPQPLDLLLRTGTDVLAAAFAASALVPGRRILALEGAGEPLRVVASEDGARLAVIYADAVAVASGPGLERLVVLPAKSILAHAAVFSPDGTTLLVASRKTSAAANMLAFSTESGAEVAAFHQRSVDADAWPPVRWNGDGSVAVRVLDNDSIHLLAGSLTGEPLARLAIPGVQQAWLAPSSAAVRFLTFSPATKSKPGAVAVWGFPRTDAPLASKAMQADGCRAEAAGDGSAFLVEMNTSSSATSYYGDSRLFLLSTDGKVSAAVTGLKDGPIHDFAWLPRGDGFIVIAGRSPPAATLHDRRGVATFSFGSGAFNSVRIAPHGRFLLLGGFGNMAGNVHLWDLNKKKELAPMFNVPCAVGVEWSPDSRSILFSTTRPRLNVDNGVRVYSHRGVLQARADFDALFQAEWRSARASTFPDRAASPPPEGGAAASSGAAAAVKPAAAPYRPPGSSGLVSEMMRAERLGTAAGPLGGGSKGGAASSAAAGAGGGPPGSAPVDQQLSAGQKKRAKEKAKKEAERAEAEAKAELERALAVATAASASVAVAAASAPAPAPAQSPAEAAAAEADKQRKKLTKKLREIEDLEARAAGGTPLNADQQGKVEARAEVQAALAALALVA